MPQVSAEIGASLKTRISAALRRKLPVREKNLLVWNMILEHEISSGTNFIQGDDQLYVFLGLTSEIVTLPKMNNGGDKLLAYLNQAYGLVANEPVTAWIYSAMRAYGLRQGQKVELRRFSAYNAKTMTTYLSCYDGHMWRVDGGGPERVTNGSEEVFFIDDDNGTMVDGVDIGPHGLLLDKLINGVNFVELGLGGITPEQQKMAFTVWLFMLAFPDLMAAKPLLLLEGTQGSGKTLTLQLIQLALMGGEKPLIISENKQDDFGVILLRSPIALFDNLDSYIKWIPDAICAYTTAGFWTKRKLFSDNEEVTVKPHAFICVASKNPSSFRREDVVDRQIILRLERRKGFKNPKTVKQEIIELRPQLFGEYLHYVNLIVEHLRVYNDVPQVEETSRMADFANFARVVGAVMQWTTEEINGMLTALENERYAFSNEEDSIMDLMHKWITYKEKGKPNIGRAVTIDELFTGLEWWAQSQGLPFNTTTRQLAQKIRSPHIEKDFVVQSMGVDGKKMYRFWRKGVDPVITLVEEETEFTGEVFYDEEVGDS